MVFVCTPCFVFCCNCLLAVGHCCVSMAKTTDKILVKLFVEYYIEILFY